MKKFGTPIGAAPGNANENVGLDDDGTPPEPRNAPGLDGDGVVDVVDLEEPLRFEFLPFDPLPEPFFVDGFEA